MSNPMLEAIATKFNAVHSTDIAEINQHIEVVKADKNSGERDPFVFLATQEDDEAKSLLAAWKKIEAAVEEATSRANKLAASRQENLAGSAESSMSFLRENQKKIAEIRKAHKELLSAAELLLDTPEEIEELSNTLLSVGNLPKGSPTGIKRMPIKSASIDGVELEAPSFSNLAKELKCETSDVQEAALKASGQKDSLTDVAGTFVTFKIGNHNVTIVPSDGTRARKAASAPVTTQDATDGESVDSADSEPTDDDIADVEDVDLEDDVDLYDN